MDNRSDVKAVLYYTGDFNFKKEIVSELQNKFSQIQFLEIDNENYSVEDIKDADIFMGWPNDDMIDIMENLKWLQLPSAGADSYIQHPGLEEEVILTNSSGVFDVPGAEHVIAFMTAFTRQLKLHIQQQEKHIWKRNPKCLEIQDSTVAVVGLGNIGKETAKKIKGLGARVIGIKRDISDKPSYVDELYTSDSINEVLKRSDFVVNTLPHTEQTDKYFSEERINNMKAGAVFINIGRGKTVDEPALIKALKKGHLEGAGLDVTAEEPLPESSPLWDMNNVIITSHSVGVSPRKPERRANLLETNIEKFLEGKELVNQVDRNLGY